MMAMLEASMIADWLGSSESRCMESRMVICSFQDNGLHKYSSSSVDLLLDCGDSWSRQPIDLDMWSFLTFPSAHFSLGPRSLLEMLCVCLFIYVLGEVTTVALLLELEQEWNRAGLG